MELSELPIRCINLSRSIDRWESILESFSGYSLRRIEAIDGLEFSSGESDSYGRPLWKSVPRNVQEEGCAGVKMYPMPYGCSLSHIKAMKDFLGSDDSWTVIIEDDVQPVGDTIDIPRGADWFYLLGSRHPGCRVSLHKDGRVRMARTLAAYLLSRKAASLAVQAMEPRHYLPTEWQIPFRCFKSMRECKIEMPSWGELPYRIDAYGQEKSVIQHGPLANKTTFTEDGTKGWLSGYDRRQP